MEKIVYLLITDLHLDINKANRINYFGEILDALSNILEINSKYKNLGYKVNQILLGDVFDGSSNNASEAMQLLELFRYYCSNFNDTFSVIGNHEITFAKNNPFWFLVSNIFDERISGLKRFIQPRGLTDCIKIVKEIKFKNCIFCFNHYGLKAIPVEFDGVTIGLFHQNVGSNEICKMWGTFDNIEEASYIQSYNYCFFGHMHLAKGKYSLNDSGTCIGEWLGTIGRTKVDEINDSDLRVNIPAILIEDGNFISIEDNYMNLKPYIECVDEVKYNAYRKSRELIKVDDLVNKDNCRTTNLFELLKTSFKDESLLFMLDFLSKDWNTIYSSYKNTLNDFAKEE